RKVNRPSYGMFFSGWYGGPMRPRKSPKSLNPRCANAAAPAIRTSAIVVRTPDLRGRMRIAFLLRLIRSRSAARARRRRQRLARQFLVAHCGVVRKDRDDGRLLDHVVALNAIERIHVRVVSARVVFEALDQKLESGQTRV